MIPLSLAYLCLDCDTLSRGPACPACASGQLVPLQRFLMPKRLRAVWTGDPVAVHLTAVASDGANDTVEVRRP